MAVTIKDVSAKCGLSISTVSKAFNNYADISLETRELVQRTAREIGYYPNAIARTLKTNRSYNLGVLFQEKRGTGLTHSFFASVLDAFKSAGEKRGYDIPFINDGTPVASPGDVLRCLAYGSASLVPYWYIPFIMTVFSAGPLIFHLPTGLLQKILLPAAVLPLLVPRLLVSPLRNLCFFVPIFLMGVYCARNRDACMAFIRRHLGAIRVTAVMSSLLIVADHYFGSFMPNIEGAYYVQKLCIGSWVLDLLEGMDREVPVLDFLARYSFPLFFLHAIFQGIFQAPLFQVLGAALPGQVFTIANLTVSVEIALCILCILAIKKVMGKRSRYLIGG